MLASSYMYYSLNQYASVIKTSSMCLKKGTRGLSELLKPILGSFLHYLFRLKVSHIHYSTWDISTIFSHTFTCCHSIYIYFILKFVWVSFRLLAHAKVESVKSKEAAEQKRLKKKSWFSFGWYNLILLALYIS